jgi:hypothetical protein
LQKHIKHSLLATETTELNKLNRDQAVQDFVDLMNCFGQLLRPAMYLQYSKVVNKYQDIFFSVASVA